MASSSSSRSSAVAAAGGSSSRPAPAAATTAAPRTTSSPAAAAAADGGFVSGLLGLVGLGGAPAPPPPAPGTPAAALATAAAAGRAARSASGSPAAATATATATTTTAAAGTGSTPRGSSSPAAPAAAGDGGSGVVGSLLGFVGLGGSAPAPAPPAPGTPAAALATTAAAGHSARASPAATPLPAVPSGTPSGHPDTHAAGGGGVPLRAHTVAHYIECLAVARWNGDTRQPVLLGAAYDLSHYSVFTRSNAKSAFNVAVETIARRVTPGLFLIQLPPEYAAGKACIVNMRDDGLVFVAFTNEEYPTRVMAAAFRSLVPVVVGARGGSWRATTASSAPLGLEPDLERTLAEYRDPKTVDALAHTAAKLADTREAVARTMVSMLERGERLEDIVGHSEQLSESARKWAEVTKPSPWCCVML